MESRNRVIGQLNQAAPASSHPPAAAAAIVTDEQASSSSYRTETTLFVAGTKNPCTFFSILPKDVTSIISAMLLTPAPKEQHGFTPNSLLKFMTDMNKDKSAAGKELFSRLASSLEKMLYQAVLDDDRDTVTAILDAYPHILLTRHEPTIIIESPYTWQKFKINASETPLSVAAKRRQIKMLSLLSPYYDQLMQDSELDEASRQAVHEAKRAGLNAWPNDKTKKNARHEDEIIIPSDYTNYINQLINIFTQESFPHGTTDLTSLSPETEAAMDSLLNWLIPETAVEPDTHIDAELLLLAAYQLHDQRLNDFANKEQRDVFCIRVIGLIQSILSPETAKIVCEGLVDVVLWGNGIGTLALQLKSKKNTPFYRDSREPLSGLGKNHLIIKGIEEREDVAALDMSIAIYTKLLLDKNIILTTLKQEPELRPSQPSNWCAIL